MTTPQAADRGRVPFAIAGIDHIVLRAHDPQRLVAFYRDVLGCSVEREQPEIGLTQLRAGGSLLDVIPQRALAGAPVASSGGSPNLDHLCLRIVPFDAVRIRAYLLAKGVASGEPALRYGAEGEGPSVYLQDPEGNGVELKASAVAE
jgi:catechol 2,3-dioxygenase-like lactoylglutathione lyase family enzyme